MCSAFLNTELKSYNDMSVFLQAKTPSTYILTPVLSAVRVYVFTTPVWYDLHESHANPFLQSASGNTFSLPANVTKPYVYLAISVSSLSVILNISLQSVVVAVEVSILALIVNPFSTERFFTTSQSNETPACLAPSAVAS